jgi:ADP-ribosylglycohydrolase
MTTGLSNIWLYIDRDALQTELRQLEDEGKEYSKFEPALKKLIALDVKKLLLTRYQENARKLLDETIKLKQKKGYPYKEPSDLAGIQKRLLASSLPEPRDIWQKEMADRQLGAWLGRCTGCYLGKAVEGVRTNEFWPFLKETGQWPIRKYITIPVTPAMKKKYPGVCREDRCIVGSEPFMPIDDDTNYTTAGLMILERHGKDFTPGQVAQFWISNIPALSTCTAERVAYRNFILEIPPPNSASFRNPYREWIGAQIRADGFAFCAAGNPRMAAEFAWRDACISHTKNGIYGEMLMAACIAAAALYDTPRDILTAGLAQIPSTSRLYQKINETISWHQEGITYDDAIGRVHSLWDEHSAHGWCHTISNAVVCAIALLWGEGNFGDSIGKAVQPGFDTDCNGATVGSIVGMMLGGKRIPEQWTERLHNTLQTAFLENHIVKIDEMANRSFTVWKKLRG